MKTDFLFFITGIHNKHPVCTLWHSSWSMWMLWVMNAAPISQIESDGVTIFCSISSYNIKKVSLQVSRWYASDKQHGLFPGPAKLTNDRTRTNDTTFGMTSHELKGSITWRFKKKGYTTQRVKKNT